MAANSGSFKPGNKKKEGTGRKKGVGNKVTNKAKELLILSIEGQVKYFDETLDRIREKNPVEWAKIMTKLFGYIVPQKISLEPSEPNLPPWMQNERKAES